MTQKNLIIFITVLFFLCSSYLFYVSDRSLRSDTEKNWWALYFEDPNGKALDFSIENHSAQNNFHWEITADSKKLDNGDIKIKTGESQTIQPEIKDITGKISITVSTSNDKKEIYKNFTK